MYIDKESREILDLLIASAPDYSHGTFSYKRICELSGLSPEEARPIVNGLVKQELAELAYELNSAGVHDMGIALTQSGRKYRELRALESRERWKERFYGFIPGIVITLIVQLILKLL